MIDVRHETIVQLNEVFAILRRGISRKTIDKWRTSGLRGNKLETFRIGKTVYTSLQSISRLEHCNG